MVAFAHEIESRNAAIPFMMQSRIDLMTGRLFREPRSRRGCAEVWLGVESGSQRILDAMDKGITVHQVAVVESASARRASEPVSSSSLAIQVKPSRTS